MTDKHIELPWEQTEPVPTFREDISREAAFEEIKTLFGTELTVRGLCPFCLGETTYTRALKLIPNASGAAKGQGKAAYDITVHCRCAMEHKGRPVGLTGCGQAWTLSIGEER